MLALDRAIGAADSSEFGLEIGDYRDRKTKRSLRRSEKKHARRSRRRSTKKRGETCAVCLDDKHRSDCMLLPCRHAFHADCISQWVQVNFSCPLCRQEIDQFMPLKKHKSRTVRTLERVWAEHFYGVKDKKENKAAHQDDDLKKGIQMIDVATLLEEPAKDTIPEKVRIFGNFRILSEGANQSETLAYQQFITTVVDVQSASTEVLLFGLGYQFDFGEEKSTKKRDRDTDSSSLGRGSQHDWDEYQPRFRWYGEAAASVNKTEYKDMHEVFETVAKEESVNSARNADWLNFRAGAFGGATLAAGLVMSTAALARQSIATAVSPAMMAKTARTSVAQMALFFTAFEHLKTNMADVNRAPAKDGSEDLEWYAKRAACATSAGLFATYAATRSLSIVGLRFGLFFGSFEHCKDMCARSPTMKAIFRNGADDNRLSMAEVGLSAAAGAAVAQSVFYPVHAMHFSARVSPMSFGAANAMHGGGGSVLGSAAATMTTAKQSLSEILVNGMRVKVTAKPAADMFSMAAFGNRMAMFLPACVGCSCMFEYSRRKLRD
jgi:hypothetical protein